jgi:serine phosphatase RsbU (regulator of sigma subunit)
MLVSNTPAIDFTPHPASLNKVNKNSVSRFSSKFLLVFFLLVSFGLFSQLASKIAEFEKKLQNATDTKSKIQLLNTLGELYLRSEPSKARKYSMSAFELSTKTNNAQGKINSCNTIGNSFYLEGDYSSSLSYYLKGLKLVEEINDKKGISNSMLGISNIYSAQKNYKMALEYLQKCLKISEDLNDKSSISGCYNNIGIIYMDLKDFDKALDYQLKSLKLKEEIQDQKGMSSNLGNIGTIYYLQEKYDWALTYQLRAFEIRKELSNKKGIAMSYIDLGNIYEKQGKYEDAVQSQLNAVKIAKEVGYKVALKVAYLSLSSVYEKLNDPKSALENYKLYTIINDSIFNKENSEKLIEMQAHFDSERKEKEIALLTKERRIQDLQGKQQELEISKQKMEAAERTKEIALKENELQSEKLLNEAKNREIKIKESEIKVQESEIKNQRMLRNSIIGGLAMVIVVVLLLAIGIRQKIKANKNLEVKNRAIAEAYQIIERNRDEIAEKNKNITDSINYASTIQQAILPSKEEMSNTLKEYFIFYKPKDIVSGDFYFYAEQHGKTVVAVADCTGHGVPGAFMSMIGNDILNKIIIENGITQPAHILNHLNQGVKKALKQTDQYSETNDGMDIAICSIDMKTKTLEFAGAIRPLYYFSGELNEIAGNKVSIGGFTSEDYVFANHTVKLNEGDSVYIMTDGYVDQFGGEKGKKFMAKNLKQLLAEINGNNMTDQRHKLKKTFTDWMGDTVQVDDILVMGIRL